MTMLLKVSSQHTDFYVLVSYYTLSINYA